MLAPAKKPRSKFPQQTPPTDQWTTKAAFSQRVPETHRIDAFQRYLSHFPTAGEIVKRGEANIPDHQLPPGCPLRQVGANRMRPRYRRGGSSSVRTLSVAVVGVAVQPAGEHVTGLSVGWKKKSLVCQ
jgi:hypothetical protein